VENLEFWIQGGRIVPRPAGLAGGRSIDRALLRERDLVHIAAGPEGTRIRWVMFTANWASLLFAKEWVKSFFGPYQLEYFNAGWFTETWLDAGQASARIDHLIDRSDTRLSSRVYVQSRTPHLSQLPPALRMCWEAGEGPESSTVQCQLDATSGKTHVNFIGSDSALAKVWGATPVSYPCLPGNSYDRAVSASYHEVVRTGRPHYDHVLASMVHPGGEILWSSYQRIVFPHRTLRNNVVVVSEAAPVAIAVL
jgi:hypothetical protein